MNNNTILHDADIREPLFEFLENEFGKIRILEEKIIGGSRADVVVITNASVIGLEIKSDADTYVRLSSQVNNYDLYFDFNYIVIGSSHTRHIEKYVPSYWGIISVELNSSGLPDFYTIRTAEQNIRQNLFYKLSMLWRPELAHIQELNGMPKYAQKSKQFVLEKISEFIPRDTLDLQISNELFERDYTLIEKQISDYRKKTNQKKRRSRKKKAYKLNFPK